MLSVLAAFSLLLGVLSFYARASRPRPDAGVVWVDAPDGVRALFVEPGGAAERAGVRSGDRLLAVAGRSVTSALKAAEAPWRDDSAPLTLALSRGNRTIEVRLQPEYRESDETLATYLATVGLFFLASGVFLLYRLGAGGVTTHYFALSLAFYAVLVFSHSGAGGPLDWVFYGLDTAGRLLFPAILLQFVLDFPGQTRAPRSLACLLYLPAVGLGGLRLWWIGTGRVGRAADPVGAIERLDSIELFYIAVWLCAAVSVLSVRSFRTTTLSVRRQLRWLSWGLGIGTTPFVAFYLIPRAVGVETPTAAGLSVLPLIVVPLAFATAILKYRLADLGLFVKHGVTALTLIFFSLALFALLNVALRHTLELPGISNRVFTVLAGVLVFLLYPPLRQAVGAIVDRAFYQGHYDYRRTLMEFGRELNSERELLPLVLRFHDRIRRTLPVRSSLLFFPDPERGGLVALTLSCEIGDDPQDTHVPADHPLCRRIDGEDALELDREERRTLPAAARRLDLHALFPMRVKGRVVAVLGIGVKDPEGALNSEDRELLMTLATHAASALEGARLYEEIRERIQEVEILKDHNESIVESSRVGILVTDAAGRIVGWNPAMEEMFGRHRADVLSKPIEKVFPEELVRLLAGAPDGRGPVHRYTLTHPDQPVRTLHVAVSDRLARAGEGGGKVVTFDDVSEQIRMEQQLVQSERLAAVGLLASGVAHEINTPLTGISSYAEMLLRETTPTASHRDILDRIRKQSWRASHIANSLLNFSRRNGSTLEKVDLHDIVEETMALFGPQLKGRRIEIRLETAPRGIAVMKGDRGRLQQILLNLLLNARDALPDGGEIVLATSARDDAVELRVADSGYGILEADLGRIYDPFFTTKGPGRGTGLGLSVTYGIVRDHGGTIEVDSKPGAGTCFTVRLPAWRPAEVTA